MARWPMVLFAVALLPACWAGGSYSRPGMAPHAAPSPTLLSLTMDCRSGTSGGDGGKEIISRTHYADALIETVDGTVQGLGPALPPFASSLCGAMFDHDALDSDDWSAPATPGAVKHLLERYDAKAMIVPAVTNDWQCLSEGELTTSCKETKLTLVAYMFTADRVLWKSIWRRGLGNDAPDLQTGAIKLFQGAPIAEVARLQDSEAPTYERALEEAGVFP